MQFHKNLKRDPEMENTEHLKHHREAEKMNNRKIKRRQNRG